MEIKIIDLLNIIAEDKELPEKFMYKGHLYYRQKTKGICYRCDELNEIFEECLVLEDLNETIEIIEEPKKIEKLKIEQDTHNSNYYIKNEYGTKCGLTKHSKMIAEKVNELIDEINNLKEKI